VVEAAPSLLSTRVPGAGLTSTFVGAASLSCVLHRYRVCCIAVTCAASLSRVLRSENELKESNARVDALTKELKKMVRVRCLQHCCFPLPLSESYAHWR
jgi:hypothetical protein